MGKVKLAGTAIFLDGLERHMRSNILEETGIQCVKCSYMAVRRGSETAGSGGSTATGPHDSRPSLGHFRTVGAYRAMNHLAQAPYL